VQSSKTIIISAAGTGSRLKMDRSKSLVEICGRPIIEWQLRQLKDVKDIVVVVGFQAEEVARTVWKIRPDALIAINHDFAATGTAASLRLGAKLAQDEVIGLDGDLLISRESLKPFLESKHPLIGIVETASQEPHSVALNNGFVDEFDVHHDSGWEWCGPVALSKIDCLKMGDRHVYQGLINLLPIAAMQVNAIEIDYPSDLERAKEWISKQDEF
jgi:choline kinase